MMTRDEALNLIREAASVASAALSDPKPTPWGTLGHDPREIEQALKNGLALFQHGTDMVDERGDDPTEGEAMRIVFELIHGAATMAAAAVLYLEECPIPYEVAKQMRARSVPA